MVINLLIALQERLQLPELIAIISRSQDAGTDERPAVVTVLQFAAVSLLLGSIQLRKRRKGV